MLICSRSHLLIKFSFFWFLVCFWDGEEIWLFASCVTEAFVEFCLDLRFFRGAWALCVASMVFCDCR